MKTTQILTLAIAALGLTTEVLAQGNNRFRGGGNGGGAGGGAASTTTDAAAATSSDAADATSTDATGDTGNDGANNANDTGADTGNNDAGGNNDLLLLADNVQNASNSIGQPDAAAGQANSDTYVGSLAC